MQQHRTADERFQVMNTTLQHHDTTVGAMVASSADSSQPSSNSTPAASGCDTAGAVTHVFTYLYDLSYRSVPVVVTHSPAGVRVLVMALPCGTLARVWDYGTTGCGVEVQSASQPGIWHEVTRAHCTCASHLYRGHCRHTESAEQAVRVFRRLQEIERNTRGGEVR
jgi:hypothetical protein